MDSTKVLAEQSGIQYQGVTDKSEADPSINLLSVIMTGQFKRGRLDKPFLVTKANYRAKLGHDPKNLDYVAVEDALIAGAPSIMIMRSGAKSPKFSCAGATSSFHLTSLTGRWDIQVNNTLYINDESLNTESFINSLISKHPGFPISATSDGFIDFFNEVPTETRVHLIPREGTITSFQVKEPQANKAYAYDESTGIISFCLAAIFGVPQPG